MTRSDTSSPPTGGTEKHCPAGGDSWGERRARHRSGRRSFGFDRCDDRSLARPRALAREQPIQRNAECVGVPRRDFEAHARAARSRFDEPRVALRHTDQTIGFPPGELSQFAQPLDPFSDRTVHVVTSVVVLISHVVKWDADDD